ncbi:MULTISPECIES: DUF2505 domain-containing protein [unclassified Mycolicibacterium]|uniref:DUF2505 domain-containing protein n=1 Tax=unclassified Mycolicibacterium TaxID=2636767 RepID=UPI0012DEC67B|nr:MULTISPECIES: DUF2505 domain-containing protein [unclassified Mycolicibacterium]MUL81758.1 DUF2505 domain-containing protein [Mycolicibacterium sp. CBMA 329]MUL87524.1 DUF2505 domain-containing protein [Mycolicibacterium sp. CBMA 331]MUL99612.1 DUF2505 domain-containing protein [Mycolicibacterium sp. CBMA 334]MUM26709.1 DUF2505 domain-containing protein [Mycolicibacterium sp. CBMA 295]MUM37821.1 DUF2505 domain-containing protein [Mycolicibacterium sp. CBMA 247]
MSRCQQSTMAFDAPAETVYAAYASGKYWQALMDRYDDLTPGKSDITEFSSDEHGIEVEFRQVLPRAELPAILRTVLPLDMAITRRQYFGPFDRRGVNGHYAASVSHAPGRLDGRYVLTGVSAGSQLQVDSTCKVSMPLVGGKLEEMVLQSVNDVFTIEGAFTADWICEHV